MITNLIASIVVTVITNTVEEFPKHAEPAVGSFSTVQLGYAFQWVNDPNPTQKKVTTTCKEITTLRFDWNGAREVVVEKLLWETNVIMELKSEWVRRDKPMAKPSFTTWQNWAVEYR